VFLSAGQGGCSGERVSPADPQAISVASEESPPCCLLRFASSNSLISQVFCRDKSIITPSSSGEVIPGAMKLPSVANCVALKPSCFSVICFFPVDFFFLKVIRESKQEILDLKSFPLMIYGF